MNALFTLFHNVIFSPPSGTSSLLFRNELIPMVTYITLLFVRRGCTRKKGAGETQEFHIPAVSDQQNRCPIPDFKANSL
jgi:hypothetical protein